MEEGLKINTALITGKPKCSRYMNCEECRNLVCETSAPYGTTNINNPHDKGYKRILKIKKNFLDFIKKYIGYDWMMDLTVDDIELVDKEFITDQFTTYESDLLYKINLKDRSVYMFILQELQSKNDFTMPFRVEVYMTAIWMDIFKNTD